MMYFTRDEFKCPCCGLEYMHQDSLDRLDAARSVAGIPYYIVSGWRCPAHNWAVGGADGSAHLDGRAADIKTKNSRDRYKIVEACLEVGFNRIGIGDGFVHADDHPNKPQDVIWTYY